MALVFQITIIVALSIYIFILHNQLRKKNIYIKSLNDKLLKSETSEAKMEIMKFIQEYKILDLKSFIPKDKILEDDIMQFIFENEKESKLFLHYTREESVAKKIVQEGFKFSHSFYKTAENVYHDKIDFIYKHNRHKDYGKFVVIISISKKVYSSYEKEVSKISRSDIAVEQILTESEPFIDEDNNKIFTLSSKFIKGYVNYETGEIFQNPVFDYQFDTEIFKRNIAKITS